VENNKGIWTLTKVGNQDWNCNVASTPIESSAKKITAKIKILEYSSGDFSGLMIGFHKVDTFNTDSCIFSNGTYLGYNCTRYGIGDHNGLTKSTTEFLLTIDYPSDQITIEHGGQKTSSPIAKHYGSGPIVFSINLYYSMKLSVEFN